MVRLIDDRTAVNQEARVFAFKVYLSPKDGERILGYLEPYSVQTGQTEVVFIKTPFGVPVRDALQKTIRLAEQWDADAIRGVDPDSLFPRSDWPHPD